MRMAPQRVEKPRLNRIRLCRGGGARGGSRPPRVESKAHGGLVSKGFRVGGAMVSEKHAGFVTNAGGATCADVLELIRRVQKIVEEKTGFVLEPEVRVTGESR